MSRFAPQKIPQETIDSLILSKLKWILDGCDPSRVFLFGSAARGELTDHSDFDFAVLFATAPQLRDARKTLFARPRTDDWPQDILLFVKEDFERKKEIGGVCEIIAEEGKILYKKELL